MSTAKCNEMIICLKAMGYSDEEVRELMETTITRSEIDDVIKDIDNEG